MDAGRPDPLQKIMILNPYTLSCPPRYLFSSSSCLSPCAHVKVASTRCRRSVVLMVKKPSKDECLLPNALRRNRSSLWLGGFSLGVDLGDSRTGVAISNGFSPRPLAVSSSPHLCSGCMFLTTFFSSILGIFVLMQFLFLIGLGTVCVTGYFRRTNNFFRFTVLSCGG